MGGAPRARARPVKPIETDLPPITVDFRDVAESAGLTAFTCPANADRKAYILEATGGGVVLVDVDNDGLLDVFLASGTTLDGDGAGRPRRAISIATWAGLRSRTSRERAGLRRTGWGQGVCAARLRQRRRPAISS